MRLFARATAFALACAAAAAAAQSGRVKRSEPAPTPTPGLLLPAQDGAGRQEAKGDSKRRGGNASDEPERDAEGNRVYLGRQVDQKARLLSRPEPSYPRRARRNGVRGRVVLRAVLAASGKVEQIAVIEGLPDGLTEEAIKAARQVKFLPAEKDGRKVSQSVIMEYNFNFY